MINSFYFNLFFELKNGKIHWWIHKKSVKPGVKLFIHISYFLGILFLFWKFFFSSSFYILFLFTWFLYNSGTFPLFVLLSTATIVAWCIYCHYSRHTVVNSTIICALFIVASDYSFFGWLCPGSGKIRMHYKHSYFDWNCAVFPLLVGVWIFITHYFPLK